MDQARPKSTQMLEQGPRVPGVTPQLLSVSRDITWGGQGCWSCEQVEAGNGVEWKIGVIS